MTCVTCKTVCDSGLVAYTEKAPTDSNGGLLFCSKKCAIKYLQTNDISEAVKMWVFLGGLIIITLVPGVPTNGRRRARL